jgi:hypothetical protein
VGAEMCIRDRHSTSITTTQVIPPGNDITIASGRGEAKESDESGRNVAA